VIPLRDTIPSRRFPVVNTVLIGSTSSCFWSRAWRAGRADQPVLAVRHGAGPVLALQRPGALVPLVSSMFLHGAGGHLISNMLALYIFGDNIEDSLGPLRYAAFYLCCGLAAGARTC